MNLEKDELKQIISEVLNEHRRIDNDTHDLHHQYIDMQIKRQKDRDLMWQKFKLSFVGALAIGVATGMAWIGKLVLEALQNGPPPHP